MAIRSILARWRAPRLSLLLLLCLVSLAPSAPAADDPIGLVDEALAANPGLEALRARIAELRELAGAAGTWDDPVIAVEYSNWKGRTSAAEARAG